MNLLKSSGCNLEVVTEYPHYYFDSVEHIFQKAEIGEEVIRPVHGVLSGIVAVHPEASFERILNIADTGLDALAASVNGSVIEHEWVLMNNTSCKHEMSVLRDRVPHISDYFPYLRGYWLGANVMKQPGTTIRKSLGTHKTNEYLLNNEFESIINDKNKALGKKTGWQLLDLYSPRQYMVAQNTRLESMEEIRSAHPLLVDLDIVSIHYK